MKATLLDLRRNPGKIVEAMERNENVLLSKRGREIAYIVPKREARGPLSLESSPAFGMWKDRRVMEDPADYVRQHRKGRFGAL